MTQYLWSKSDTPAPDDVRIQQFMSGQDVVLDREIFLYDIRATIAHAAALGSIGILADAEIASIKDTLHELADAFQKGEYQLAAPFEDGHSAIEFRLIEELGPVGQKVHTGRSRNDQVQVAMRMYLQDQMHRLTRACDALAQASLERAEQDEMSPMPGYTHLQRAVPSSVGLWMSSFAESFLDIAELSAFTESWINKCPLGSAAGYGVNLPLNREQVAAELGFQNIQWNPMYVQNSRGRFELQCLSVLSQATLELRRLCWDLSLYTSQEFGFVQLGAGYVTGSSIMPNKSNPDFVELARAQHAVVQAATTELQAVLSLPSGYQRDLQLTKPPVIRAFGSSLDALELSAGMIRSMAINHAVMESAIDDALYSTDVAIERVTSQGIPFREAYRQPVSEDDLQGRTAQQSLQQRVSPGACADLGLSRLRARLEQLGNALGN